MRDYKQRENICFKCAYKKGLKDMTLKEGIIAGASFQIKLCKECMKVYKKLKDEDMKEWISITDKVVTFYQENVDDAEYMEDFVRNLFKVFGDGRSNK